MIPDDDVACSRCGIEPWRRDQLDVACELRCRDYWSSRDGKTDMELSADRVREYLDAYESWHYDEIGQSTPQDVMDHVTTSSGDYFELRRSDLRRLT